MMNESKVLLEDWQLPRGEGVTRECERINARLRHFRGVAASVLGDAVEVWEETWELLQDPRTCDEILDGHAKPPGEMPESRRSLLMEKIHLLGFYIDYARKLCEGSIGSDSQDEGGV